jgi:regulator of chromosome condensation
MLTGNLKGGIEKVSSIAAGDNHILALTTEGNLYSWGSGEQDQLGRRILARHKIGGTVPEKVLIGKRGKSRSALGG